jgi:uncharacterized protein (DUF1501 family)
MRRRTALQLLGGGAAALLLRRSFAKGASANANDEFFVFIHATGGWDVTLWSDPRNERAGIVEPASTDNTDVAGVRLWQHTALQGATRTFQVLAPNDVNMRLGPGIGGLYDLRDRLTVINGLAMNTVSHTDGTTFSATGRHLQGGRAPASSVDVVFANTLGVGQLVPDVSVRFPSWYVGDQLDRRAVPLRIKSAETIAASLNRGGDYLHDYDRADVSAFVSGEARDLAATTHSEVYDRYSVQIDAEQKLISDRLAAAFTADALKARYPQFDYKLPNIADGAIGAAFAIEAMRRNLARCVSLGMGSLDTHAQNYRQHAHSLQELFDTIAALVRACDGIPHPTRTSSKLSEHLHVLVISDFCRTPQINLSGGRDHYPNNSALIISPRFLGGRTFGETDREQVLPVSSPHAFAGGPRPVAPPDVLATFMHAFGIEPAPYVRDGEVVAEWLRTA